MKIPSASRITVQQLSAALESTTNFRTEKGFKLLTYQNESETFLEALYSTAKVYWLLLEAQLNSSNRAKSIPSFYRYK